MRWLSGYCEVLQSLVYQGLKFCLKVSEILQTGISNVGSVAMDNY